MKTRIKKIIEDFKYKFMYSCSGCTDPKSEGTHQMESIQHWDESKTKAFLTHALTQIEVEARKEERIKILKSFSDLDNSTVMYKKDGKVLSFKFEDLFKSLQSPETKEGSGE